MVDREPAGQRAVDRIDDERDAQPHEHHLPVALVHGAKRQQRQHRPACRQEMDRSGAETRDHGRGDGMERLEAALDLAEDGDVAILFERAESVRRPQLQLLLVLAVEHIKAEIELGQDGIAK